MVAHQMSYQYNLGSPAGLSDWAAPVPNLHCPSASHLIDMLLYSPISNMLTTLTCRKIRFPLVLMLIQHAKI